MKAFIAACRDGRLDTVKERCRSLGMAKPGFQAACMNGHLAVVQYLFETWKVNPEPGDLVRGVKTWFRLHVTLTPVCF